MDTSSCEAASPEEMLILFPSAARYDRREDEDAKTLGDAHRRLPRLFLRTGLDNMSKGTRPFCIQTIVSVRLLMTVITYFI